jgi:sec-independent protein translocase protein TatA
MLSPLEIGACVAVAVLLFGVKRLPELGSGVGEAISNFRKSYRNGLAIDVTPEPKKVEGESSNNNSETQSNNQSVKNQSSDNNDLKVDS